MYKRSFCIPASLIPIPASLIPIPASLIPIPASLIPITASLIPIPASLIPITASFWGEQGLGMIETACMYNIPARAGRILYSCYIIKYNPISQYYNASSLIPFQLFTFCTSGKGLRTRLKCRIGNGANIQLELYTHVTLLFH